MGFGGHVLDMTKRMEQNRVLQKQYRRSYHQRKIDLVNEHDSPLTFNDEKFKPKTKEEIVLIKQTIYRENRKSRWFQYLLVSVLIGIAILAFLLIV